MAAAYEKAKIEIKAVAQKQLGIDLSVVSPLVDSEWPDFLQQIKTCVPQRMGAGSAQLQRRRRR